MVVVRVDGICPYVYCGCESLGVHGCVSITLYFVYAYVYCNCIFCVSISIFV